MAVKSLQAIFLLSVLCFGVVSYASFLSTQGRWIVDSSGRRVKLACTSWASHMEPMLAEGLHKKPLKDIVAKLVQLKFNCVRLTWATYMFTRHSNNTVTQTLDNLKLAQAKQGIAQNNPALLSMTHIQAFEAVIDELGKQGIMVVLDNHVSNPKWCCADEDGNGFFKDADFDPTEWQLALSFVAAKFSSKNQVVGMSLRNELRGPRQNEDDWYNYVLSGAANVHVVNPNVLVILSGLNYDTDLGFLKKKVVDPSNWNNKLVYETHWYSWSVHANTCDETINVVYDHALFLQDGAQPVPLFLSEFGFNQTGKNEADNAFINCFLTGAAKYDLSWSLWALQGSYYIRESKLDYEEVFGVLNADWDTIRNPQFMSDLQKLHPIK
ncbi:hypothetical protein Ddye_002751 [Dipteronia dyeriana]|uniref:Glycoside hydrolase family 5 domain-containing protein n=1 Tax=Dipteronia dyeriana TaxID=168575 RepID=A0AAD9XRH5_9ROSI|nr:hypothetical protein Ddye_002751 [Dipteronia dyeriana]